MKSYLLLFIPNVLKCFEFEALFSEHTSECDRLVAMVQIRLEVLNENWSECVLQVHASFLIRQLAEFVFHRFDETVYHINGQRAVIGNIANIFFVFYEIENTRNSSEIVVKPFYPIFLQIMNSESISVQTFDYMLDDLISETCSYRCISFEIFNIIVFLVVHKRFGQFMQCARFVFAG